MVPDLGIHTITVWVVAGAFEDTADDVVGVFEETADEVADDVPPF